MGVDKIDLILVGSRPGQRHAWANGDVRTFDPSVQGLCDGIDQWLDRSDADAWLFWDPSLGQPDTSAVQGASTGPGDLWHAGLRLGLAGLPRSIDHVVPTWMFNRDPDPGLEATSWRMSFRACLIRTSVLRSMGSPESAYQTLTGMSLDYGHRCIRRGVLCRHAPWLVPEGFSPSEVGPTPEDELRFIRYRFGLHWAAWALMGMLRTGTVQISNAPRLWRSVAPFSGGGNPPPYSHSTKGPRRLRKDHPTVSVVIPTIDRYPYLRTLLRQLGHQTASPTEIIVVDQTPRPKMERELQREFSDLPLTVLPQDKPGQCTSRNRALERASGEYILFVDDDDEVGSTLIEDHLRTIAAYRCEVSSGVAHEVGSGELPDDFKFLRASDVFPTNNSMVRRDTLARSGLFDLAYDRASRADKDLGMRIYLSGALMILDPTIDVLHHHAPRGGLRTHGARVVTYASSRARLFHWHLPSTSELYLATKYFSTRQVREKLWLAALGTFRLKKGGPVKKILKVAIGILRLPVTLWQLWWRRRKAVRLLRRFPVIPELPRAEPEGPG